MTSTLTYLLALTALTVLGVACAWRGIHLALNGDTDPEAALMTTLVGISAFTGSYLLRKGQHR
uniref:hypothetical protein n=1 Tax=Streptosporangium sp. CA-235898 TaxID=3240073 RepID=UPI003F4964FD